VAVGYAQLKKTGMFLVPGFAKFVAIKKPASEAHNGINPFTKGPMIFKAKVSPEDTESSSGESRRGRARTAAD